MTSVGLSEVTNRLSGWGRYPSATCRISRPDRLSDLVRVTRGVDQLIARGLGRSYGDAAFTNAGRTVLTTRMNRLLSFDSSTGILECEPGVSIADIIECFLPRGFIPPVLPGTRFVTVGGALACDIHGKNHHRDGSWGRHVLDFDLLAATGETMRCSRTENADAFWATIGGMGLTGIVTRMRLKLDAAESNYIAVNYRRSRSLEEILNLFDSDDDRFKYSVAWIDCSSRKRLGRGVLMRANPDSTWGKRGTVSPPRPRRLPMLAPHLMLNRWSIGAFNAMYYRRFPKRETAKSVEYYRYFFPLDNIAEWNRLYGPNGFLQYQCVVPQVHGALGLRRILERFSDAPGGGYLAVLKRFGATEPDQLLSFPMPGYTLAVDLPHRGRDTLRLLDDIDAIVIELGGRVYLAKDARLSARSVRAMYSRFDDWRKIRDRLDPDGRFSSDLSRRLKLAL